MAESGGRAPVAQHMRHHRQVVQNPQPRAPIPGPQAPNSSPAQTIPAVPIHVPESRQLSGAPRALILRRNEGHGFGFTLRHLVVYPPETFADLYYDKRHAVVGAVDEPMDTIFVRSVREGSSAQKAGLRPGDRLVAVDGQGVAGWPYSRVVHLIQRAPHTLRLHVVPKEADMLQKYFGEAAYNPETNQRPQNLTRERRTSTGEMPLTREMLGLGPTGATTSVHQIYTTPSNPHYRPITQANSANKNTALPSDLQTKMAVYHQKPEIRTNINDSSLSDRLYSSANVVSKEMPRVIERISHSQSGAYSDSRNARRASDGAKLMADPYAYYASPPSSPFNSSRDSSSIYTSGESINNSYKSHLPYTKPVIPSQITTKNYPITSIHTLIQPILNANSGINPYFNTLEDRRESNTSLTSCTADSKDSLSSFDSVSTLTGHETDESIFLNRIRKSLEQKEAFLRRPSQPTGWITPEDQTSVIPQKEFYARPQKLHKSIWPPSVPGDQSPSRNKENICENIQPSTNFSENNFETKSANQSSDKLNGALESDTSKQSACVKQKQDKLNYVNVLSKISENSPTSDCSNPSGNESNEQVPMSPDLSTQDKRYPVPLELQIVSNRMKQFQSQTSDDKTEMYKSELARLSTKKPEPTVALRRKEFESKGSKREAKSLEGQLSLEEADCVSMNLSGNRMTITGGKHLTCPPPENMSTPQESEKVLVRMRSNSTGSEGLPTRRTHNTDGSYSKRRYALSKEQMEVLADSDKNHFMLINENNINETNCDKRVPNGVKNHHATKNTAVNNINCDTNMKSSTNSVFKFDQQDMSAVKNVDITHGTSKRPERPNQLSLAPNASFTFAGGIGGLLAMASTPTTPSSPHSQPQSPSGISIDDGVVMRRPKNVSHLGAEEERAMRRVSYLKAIWGDRIDLENDNDFGDSKNQPLRSAHRRWRPPRFPDDIQPLRRIFEDLTNQTRDKKEREELSVKHVGVQESPENSNIIMQGSVQIKLVLVNGKRASDRSWKQAWAVLQGPKLTLYRHQHQSPSAGGSSESLNLRFSMADMAGDYTKRKHVVRVTSIAGAELLLQAGGASEAAKWLQAFRTQANGEHNPEPERPIESPADGSGLSPPSRSKKPANTRTMSPTVENQSPSLTASPKSKTWKGRVARQLRRMQAGTMPGHHVSSSNNILNISSGIGVPLERCEPMLERPLVPNLVGLCTRAVEDRGLHVVGVYRIPGNTASVTALKDALERGIPPDLQDPRWSDVNVVSSLLKAFFRHLPNPLLTKELYPMFITADKLPDNSVRVRTIRRLVRGLPDHHYETLKFLMEHLKRVVAESSVNKMEARNLAIVFGPTLVRSADDSMLTMVNDMSSQCRIIESLINHTDWYFDEDDRSSPINDIIGEEEISCTTNQALLLQNVKKIEGKGDVSTKDIVSSIISAANRKIQRKPRSKPNQTINNETSSPVKKEIENIEAKIESPANNQPATDRTVTSPAPAYPAYTGDNDNYPIKTYTGLDQLTQERVKRFEMDIRAVLRREKKRDPSGNEWQNNARNELQPSPSPLNLNNIRGSHSSDGSDSSLIKSEHNNNNVNITGKRLKTDSAGDSQSDGAADMVSSLTSTFDQKLRSLHNSSPASDQAIPFADETLNETQDFGDPSLHRNTEQLTRNSKTVEKSTSSSESNSLNETLNDEESPKLYSDKNAFDKNDKCNDNINSKNVEKQNTLSVIIENNENISKFRKCIEHDSENEKDIDITSAQTSPADFIPDNNGKKMNNFSFTDDTIKKKVHDILCNNSLSVEKIDQLNLLLKSKLKSPDFITHENSCNNKTTNDIATNETSDSGIDTEKSNSPKLRRSVSLNRSDVKLKRSESLTKNEKTECNILRKREIGSTGLQSRPSIKLKRKNGMPERSIKRRHTVGGTKDFDKNEWAALGCSRTSSPDLPTSLIDNIQIPMPLESHV